MTIVVELYAEECTGGRSNKLHDALIAVDAIASHVSVLLALLYSICNYVCQWYEFMNHSHTCEALQ